MDRDHEIGAPLVGDVRPLLQRNELVLLARVDDLRAHPPGEELAQTLRDVEDHVLLAQSSGPDGSRVMTAVPGIDENAIELESQGSREAVLAVGGSRGGAGRVGCGGR